MIRRILWDKALQGLSKQWRLICITGPRQIGKTTFLKNQGAYFSFDDPKLRHSVNQDPVAWLKNEYTKKTSRIILDEATRLPELFEAMKIMADQNPNTKGKIWFASSSNYQLNRNIRESLAGRVYIYKASPLLLSEITQCHEPDFFKWLYRKKINSIYIDQERIIEAALNRSLFPDPYISNESTYAQQWLEQYISTYILQDLTQGFPKVDFSKWQTFIQLLFSYPASRISMNRLASILNIHHETIHQYFILAKAALLCEELPVFSKSKIKRLTKGSKYIMVDSALCKAHHETIERGVLFENLIISQIIYYLNASQIKFKAFHWHTADDAEVDLVLEGDFGIIPIEIKSTKAIKANMFSGLKSFFEAHPYVKKGCIIYEGAQVMNQKNIDILPAATLFMPE